MIKGLRYTVKSVRAYNKANKDKKEGEMKAFDLAVQGLLALDIDSITELIALGMQSTEEKAEELLQSELDETGDLVAVADDIREVITKQGFTPWAKAISLKKQYTQIIETQMKQLLDTQETEKSEKSEKSERVQVSEEL